MQTNTVTLENSLIVSRKTEYATTLWSSIPVPGHLSQRNDDYVYTNTCTQMLIAVLFIIVKNWKKKKTHMFFSRWMAIQTVVHPHHGMLLSSTDQTTSVTLQGSLWWGKKKEKKSIQKSSILCPFIEHFYKWQVYRIVDSRDEEWRMKTRRGHGCGCKRETALVGKIESMWTFWLCYRSIYLLQ